MNKRSKSEAEMKKINIELNLFLGGDLVFYFVSIVVQSEIRMKRDWTRKERKKQSSREKISVKENYELIYLLRDRITEKESADVEDFFLLVEEELRVLKWCR